ncbi:hypothetical protein K457DRAFT_22585 [Linnemannia elongata AG-77]|uniref:F-box domain-containing protein n=1 Tax=Linnemannia elongata AG-77 TaxID=1314771 RepID=A0A197JLS2_9FUNG|nr:hypothetical protein K457DRAFT_22585 [Linnemannia elongata AG-77]
MSASISIFDITLIVDTICQSLSLCDIQNCRKVNKQWSSLFKPHLWSHLKLPSTATLTDDRIATILDHKRWIRSLTIAAPHIEKISALGFTHLQEIILYDQNFTYSYEGEPTPLPAIESLLDNNPDLRSLEVDLNRYHYRHFSKHRVFSAALMLAIERHPSLTRLAWHVPDGHVNEDFARCLFYMCQQRPLQELYVLSKEHLPLYCNICDGCCSVGSWSCESFNMDDENYLEMLPTFRQFKQAAEKQAVGPMKPFAFRKLELPFEFHEYYLPLLRNSPDIQEVLVDLSGEYSEEVLEALVRCTTLRGLDLRYGGYDMDCAREVQRFSQLRTVRFPAHFKEQLQFHEILKSLRSSSQDTLEVMGLFATTVSPEDVISIIGSFPNLKEIDMGSVQIHLRDYVGSTFESYVPGADDRSLEDCIVRDWDPLKLDKPHGGMSQWWDHWTKAKQFMCAVSSAYVQQSRSLELRPIHMRFMYPIKAFMSEKEATAYAKRTGAWRSSEKRTLTVEDASRMIKVEEEEARLRIEEWNMRNNPDTDEERAYRGLQFNSYEFEFNEYDAVATYEPAREYVISKSRNRHHSLHGKKASPFRRPFKK